MSRGGKNAKPTKLRVLQGNAGKRPLPVDEPQPPEGLEKPDWLSEGASAEWDRMYPRLEALGLLTEIDATAFEGYCDKYGQWRYATEQVKKHGMVIQTPNGLIQLSPMVSICERLWKELRLILQEFGMTPASRTKVSGGKGGGDDSPFGEFK